MAAAVFVLVSLPRHASACGGFFCNRQGIQQTGERVLFSYEPDGSVTTVVQIAYAGPSYVSNRHEATLRYDCGPAYFRWSAPQTLITEGGEQVVFEGVEYGGTNDDYCEDEGFRPGRPIEELREIAARRAPADVLGGGGLRCGAAPRGAGLPWALVFFPVLLVVRRARR